MPTTVDPSICDIDSLPSPPHVALKVIQISNDPEQGVADLCDVLALDSSLCASVLKVANSTAYSRGRQFDSIQQAVAVMGAKATSAVALGFSLKASVPSWSHPNGLSDVLLWRQAIASGVACRGLSRLAGYPDDQRAFLCGLLSRIGQLLLYTAAPDAYGKVLDESTTRFPPPELEKQFCGYTHHEIGHTLLTNWKLPPEVCHAIKTWGEPGDEETRRADDVLAKIVAVADALADLLTGEDYAAGLERAHHLGKTLLGISEGEIERMFMTSEQEFQETLQVFGDPIGANINCEAILEEARQSLILMSIGLAADLAQANQNTIHLEEENRSLEESANTDALTGLPNRAALAKEANAVWECVTSNPKRLFTVIMVDIDHFKSFNDSLGHAAGDLVLQEVGKTLRDTARGTDFVARYGGEEFTILLANADREKAGIAAERFRRAIEDLRVDYEGQTLQITASLGGACWVDVPDAHSMDKVIEAADQALYDSKRGGRNQVSFFEESN